ncbi:ferritin-like metal-binding protein YciE [Chitinophaga niastensis]|uniref:Ferritin-like metal-binding protein YciE n=1 Tax=Chitinophaga niastensis TaxID=536980 RepID=A0A2P8HS66_CHINA|nr:ferritin-like domain-containing protein [Chitinophaga niastensis]PSL49053.1 ferritin-like metal-binding protein YciE [Chitinophaga niastensis]
MPTSKTAAHGVARRTSEVSEFKFHELFMEELKDIFWAEKNLVKALHKMQKAATSEELITRLENHLEETKGHVLRLEEIFKMLGKKPQTKKCEAMEGLLAESQRIVADTADDSAVRDAGIIIATQKIEHYEIAAYGSLRSLASVMGYMGIAEILEQTLLEEKIADSHLTEVADSTVNEEAAAE